jgi:putative hemolysin
METAYTTFDAIIVGSWKKTRSLGARIADFFSSHPERFLYTTLVSNNALQVAFSSLVVLWADAQQIPEIWIVTLTPLTVLVAGEIVPKTFALAFANPIVRFLSFPLWISYWLVAPVRWFLRRRNQDTAKRSEDILFRRELDAILSRAHREGTVTEKESEILDRYLRAREIRARDIMTPRPLLVGLPNTASVDEALAVIRTSRYSVIPVYEQDLDRIIGILHSRDLLRPCNSIPEITRRVEYVPESKPVIELLQQFREMRIHAAIVVDEHGGTDGIVTLKDIFRELVGPIRDSSEHPRGSVIKRLTEGRFLVSGLADLSDIAEETGWEPPTGDYATLSGLLAEHLGRIAKSGEEFVIEGITIRVVSASARRVESCLVKLPRVSEGQEW